MDKALLGAQLVYVVAGLPQKNEISLTREYIIQSDALNGTTKANFMTMEVLSRGLELFFPFLAMEIIVQGFGLKI